MTGTKQTMYFKSGNYEKLCELAEKNNMKPGPLLNYIIEHIDSIEINVKINFKGEVTDL